MYFYKQCKPQICLLHNEKEAAVEALDSNMGRYAPIYGKYLSTWGTHPYKLAIKGKNQAT
jgi:hypothetical protein